jgi:hypothetical protein
MWGVKFPKWLKWAVWVNFGRLNEIGAGLGRFSGSLSRLEILPEQSGYSMTDVGYLRTKISDNGQKRRNELFESISVVYMQLRWVWVCFRVLRIVWKHFRSNLDTLWPISDSYGLKISDNGQNWPKLGYFGQFWSYECSWGGFGYVFGCSRSFASASGAIRIVAHRNRIFTDWKYPITVQKWPKWAVLVNFGRLNEFQLTYCRFVCVANHLQVVWQSFWYCSTHFDEFGAKNDQKRSKTTKMGDFWKSHFLSILAI